MAQGSLDSTRSGDHLNFLTSWPAPRHARRRHASGHVRSSGIAVNDGCGPLPRDTHVIIISKSSAELAQRDRARRHPLVHSLSATALKTTRRYGEVPPISVHNLRGQPRQGQNKPHASGRPPLRDGPRVGARSVGHQPRVSRRVGARRRSRSGGRGPARSARWVLQPDPDPQTCSKKLADATGYPLSALPSCAS
jgi:hypothetical protein